MKELINIPIMCFTGCDTPSHKEPTEAIKYPIAQLPDFTFGYIKGKAYGQTAYVLAELTTGMEFARAGNLKGLDNAIATRLKTFGATRINALIKEMQDKYKDLPVLDIQLT